MAPIPDFLGVNMSEVVEVNRGKHSPVEGVRALSFKVQHFMDNPTYFYPDGIWVYCGPQGSGKTLSAVQCALNLHKRYPKAVFCSNLDVHGLDYIPFVNYAQIGTLSNGTEGVVFLLDELHILWNSLESKNVPISEMASFCQMRKNRRVIIGTSQVYGRIAKPIREQLKYVYDCHNVAGVLQVNTLIDPTVSVEKNGVLHAVTKGTNWFFHTPELYASYDTLYKVEKVQRG